MDANLSYLVEQIEAELERLEMACSQTNVSGWIVSAEPELPAGWVRIYDDNESFYGAAASVLRRLEDCKGDEATDYLRDGSLGPCPWVSGSLALEAEIDGETLLTEAPAVDKDDHWTIAETGIETEGEGIDGLKVLAVLTNGGIRYHFAPCNPDYYAGNYALGFSERFETAVDALQSAEWFLIQEATREKGAAQ